MSKFGKELIKSMEQADRHIKGANVRGMRVMAVTDEKRESKKRAPRAKLLPCPFCGGEAVVMKD